MNLCFALKFHNYLDLFSTPISQTKYVMPAINSENKYEKIIVVAHVLQNSQNFGISRCCFAEDGY